MRQSIFGDTIIESVDDDLGLVESLQEAGDAVHGVIRKEIGEDGFCFEVLHDDNGEIVVSSESIFETEQAARDYLRGFVSDIYVDR